MAVKDAIIKAKIENAIVELMIKTNVENVYLDETTTLASKLAEIVTAINEREKSADVDTKIQTAIDGLINGAPATYDTLKEIADYLATHENEYTALVQTVAGKVNKETGKGLSTNDYTTAEKNKLSGVATGAQVNVIEKISVNGTAQTVTSKGVNITVPTGALATKDKVAEADLDATLKSKIDSAAQGNHSHANKAVLDGITSAKVSAWDGKPDVYIQSSQPTALKENDIWVQIVQ